MTVHTTVEDAAQAVVSGRVAPHRQVLLVVTGLTPQVVTETIYALWKTSPELVPAEVHLITTVQGADHARLNLLSPRIGWMERLRGEYQLPPIAFPPENIHVIPGTDGTVLDDIRSPQDNLCAADFITELVRRLTEDPESALHVSMAGGRKTMGYFVGYALSLFGRSQDRLSHVLVSQPFESQREFYYPSRDECPIHVQQNGKEVAYDCRTAQVDLAWIPFVRLRAAQHEPLLDEEGKTLRAFGLRDGMLPSYFNSKNSALNRTLKDKLGTLAALPYLVLQPDEGAGYALSLPPERIHYAALDAPRQDAKGRTRGATT